MSAETVVIGSVIADAGGGKGWLTDREYAGLVATTSDGRSLTVDVTTDKAGLARAHLAGAIQGIAIGETLTVADPRGQGETLRIKVVANAGAVTLDTAAPPAGPATSRSPARRSTAAPTTVCLPPARMDAMARSAS